MHRRKTGGDQSTSSITLTARHIDVLRKIVRDKGHCQGYYINGYVGRHDQGLYSQSYMYRILYLLEKAGCIEREGMPSRKRIVWPTRRAYAVLRSIDKEKH